MAERVRLDVWLDVSCLFKTRTAAQKACKGGKVEVNGVAAKPHREVQAGDEVRITRQIGGKQLVRVRDVIEDHIPKAQARALYDDMTPPPTAEEQAFRDLIRAAGGRVASSRSADKRERRRLRRLKEGE